jgi:uncharacterized membrane protein YphA (DoxX/SURF4 family)
VLFDLKTRWPAITLFGFCSLTALFFHAEADQAISEKRRYGPGLSRSGLSRPDAWSLDAWRARAV